MKKKLKVLVKKQKGSVTLFVLIAMLFFLMIAIGMYASIANRETAQIKETERIKATYEKDMKQIDNLYYSYYNEEYTKEGYIKNGLVLQYDAMNNTGNSHDTNSQIWKDLSGNQNNGILYNFTNTENNGWKDNCLEFGGGSFINIPTLTDLKNPVTLELVFKHKTITDDSQIIFVNTSSRIGLGLYKTNQFIIESSAGKTEPDVDRIKGNSLFYIPNDVVLTNINQVAITLDEKEMTDIRVNNKGNLTVSGSNFWQEAGVSIIGRRASKPNVTSGNGNFSGYLYSIRLYDRVLSNQELTQNYNIDKQRYEI